MELLKNHLISYVLFAFISLSFPYLYLIPGTSLLKCFNEAVEMSAKQTKIFDQLSVTFSPEAVNKWEAMVAKWNTDPKAPNPYCKPESCKSHLSDIVFILLSIILYRNYSLRCSPSVSQGRGSPSSPW
jgi:hypothetical protein